MGNSPKIALLNNIDDLDLTFIEGENELEFEIDDYSFTVTYSLETDDIFVEDEEEIKGGKKLRVISIHAYNNLENVDIDVYVDDDIQKLFSDYYYYNVLMEENFEPLNVNFGEFSDLFNE